MSSMKIRWYYNYPSYSGAYSDVYTGPGGSDTITTGTDGLGDWVFTTGGGVGFGVSENADTPAGFQNNAIKDGFFGGVYAGGVLAITPTSTTVNLNNPGGDQIFYSQFVGGPVGGIDNGSTSNFAAPLAVTDNYGQFLGGGEVFVERLRARRSWRRDQLRPGVVRLRRVHPVGLQLLRERVGQR